MPDERPHGRDVEGEIEREPKRVERIDAGPLELVEAPFDDRIRSRAREFRANAR